MVPFNYGGCENCRSKMNDTKLALISFLPASVCSMISSYNVYYSKCCKTRDLEHLFC